MSTYYAFTSPAAGHLFPMVPGLLELQARGHDVHLRTAPELVDAARSAGLRDVESVDPRILEFEATDYEAASPKERLTRGLEDLMQRGPHEMAQFSADVAALRPDVLLTDRTRTAPSSPPRPPGCPGPRSSRRCSPTRPTRSRRSASA
ncbi:MAG: hypothetical protein QOG77_1190 [Solirubrobacteraceae bacterium]|nr:hypothetical protein [Solirubrobacteraceae bacterium]